MVEACLGPHRSLFPLVRVDTPTHTLTRAVHTLRARQVFKLFDDDNTNTISFKNLQRVARELGENLTDEELHEMIDEADRDGTCA